VSRAGSLISLTASARWSIASGPPRRNSAAPSSRRTRPRSSRAGGSASARLSSAAAATGDPRTSAPAATRRRSSTRFASPVGSAFASLGRDPLLRGARPGQDLRRAGMRGGPCARADIRVHGLPHDRMRELERCDGPQQPKLDQQVGGGWGLPLGHLGQARCLFDARAVTQDGDGAYEACSSRGRSRQAQEHRLGHRCRSDVPHAGRPPRVRRESLLAHLAQQRLEEEGIAARGLPAGSGELGRHGDTERTLAQSRRRLATQRSWSDHLGLGGGREPSQLDGVASPGRVDAKTTTRRPSRRGPR
jgi:hypothetical protein